MFRIPRGRQRRDQAGDRLPGKEQPVKCIIASCHRTASTNPSNRGLCMPCYGDARHLIRTEQTTWAELVSLGLAMPSPAQGTGNKLSLFWKAYTEAKDKASQPAQQPQQGQEDEQAGREPLQTD